MLGHKHLLSVSRAAVNVKGCRALAEAGFEKFDEIDGVHSYRKPN
jgi:hypothetical protein